MADATRAGDAFTGAFVVALFEGQTVQPAAAFAVAASALAIILHGSQAAYPTRERLQEQLRAGRLARSAIVEP